ncbi:MAG: LacI family DNA-binding transcriptional regulator [Paraglaciecola sp.]|uniref:LacI family DNA-binding transcriptional regulator n=1 Tax=Paraglaciecola sp. TaxID=1920173 RepID=UPI00326494AB
MTNIRKVSELAGVSTATVSRTLKSPNLVKEKTREKVMLAVKKSGYRPNWLASSVKRGKSQAIVVLVPNFVNQFFLRIIEGIENAAQASNYSVLLGDTQGNRSLENKYASMVLTSRADGLIQLGQSFPFSKEDEELGEISPLVSVCDRIVGRKFPFIELDNFGASRAIAHHLMALGHSRIAIIGGQRESKIFEDRVSGLVHALSEEDIEFDYDLLVGDNYSYANGEVNVEKLFKMPLPPTAVVCLNDDIAIGAIRKIKSMGLSVPDDISVVGFDNIPVAPYIDPPLTTIDQPAFEMGQKAFQMLLNIIEGNTPKRHRNVVPFELILRESTANCSSL